MKKKLDEKAIANELADSVYFQSARRQESLAPDNTPDDSVASQPASRPVGQPAGQPAAPSVEQSTASHFDTSPILGRPKSFYITEKQDSDLDAAVNRLAAELQGRLNQKIDRSTVIRLLLESGHLSDEKTIQQLADHLVQRTITQLSGQPAGQSTG